VLDCAAKTFNFPMSAVATLVRCWETTSTDFSDIFSHGKIFQIRESFTFFNKPNSFFSYEKLKVDQSSGVAQKFRDGQKF